MTLMMFLLLSGYYLLKTAREVFILSEGGAEVKSYASAGQALLLLFLVPAYGAFASRVSRIQLVTWVLALLRVATSCSSCWRRAPACAIGVPYFLWLGIFNVMVIAQFWALRQRHLHAGTGQAAVSADRRRQQPGRAGSDRCAPAR